MKDSEHVIKTDHVIVAIGQALKTKEILGKTKVDVNRWNFFKVNPLTRQTSAEWIFAGGDATTGPASVVEAIAAGEKAAVGIDKFITGEEHAFWRKDKGSFVFFNPDDDPVDTQRGQIKTIAVSKRKGNFDEVELPWKMEVAIKEAKRCLRCDYREDSAK